MRVRVSIAIAVFVISSVLPSRAAATAEVPTLGPGLHTQTFARDGRPAVGYSISIPPSYGPATTVPLVLALHFGVQGGPSRNVGRDVVRLLFGPGFADLGAIIVAPDVLGGGPWSTPENEDAVLELLDAVMRSYAIDRRKVVVTGFSMGGAGAWHLAGKYPERFAAVVPVAGRPPAATQGWRVPVLAVHSRRDQVVPIGATEARIAELTRAGVRAELVALDGPTHYQTTAHTEGLARAVAWLRGVLR